MADHLAHSLVREGVALRPKSIQTIAGYLDAWAPQAAAPDAVVHLAMQRALERVRPARYRDVAEFPGVVRALSALFAEVSGQRLPDDVGRLFAHVERDLEARGFAPRYARLAAAAKRIAQNGEPVAAHIFFDGFFKFSTGELELIAALTSRTDVTIALHQWPGAERAREVLLAGGFDVQVVEADPPAAREVIRPLNIEREADEIARRILQEVAQGRAFREIGIIARSQDLYGPLLETTLARFGIPFRNYLMGTLAAHPHVRFLSQLVRSALAGWDQELLLPALQAPASGLGGTRQGDELDFAIRKALPVRGWEATAGPNSRDRLEPAEWAARLQALQQWSPALAPEDHASLERVQAWRSSAAARAAWDDAMESAAVALSDLGRIPLEQFWSHVETGLALETLRVADQRRNVVHLLDAHEARQWRLPVVFVCGLLERQFPKYHYRDAIVGDEARRNAGLDTAEDHDREERFLFEVAITRATRQTVLSYPQFDEAGQPALPSFFLQGLEVTDCVTKVRPAPSLAVPRHRDAPIQDEVLQQRLAEQHTHLSASSVESYLQCPFRFFARKTLKLTERPKAPRDRLDVLVQGNIFHAAAAEWTLRPFLDAAALDGAFEDACHRHNIPHTYRSEAVRLELLRNFENFIRDETVQVHWESHVEKKFTFTLPGGLELRGTIDRLDVHEGQALVIDYKYSAAHRLKDRIEDSVAGNLVQAGVYLLAAAREFGLEPAGMLFCATKKSIAWDGWHCGIAGLEEVGGRRTREGMADLASDAEQAVLRVYDEIVHGRIAVQPNDATQCDRCECRDICRVESIARVKEASA
ncbi:MAG: hypothetical protein RL328_317 [Acidobacteriota bacterium]